MPKKPKVQYISETKPCIRCGVTLVETSRIEPVPYNHPKPPPWEGACRECWTEEDLKIYYGNLTGHFLVGFEGKP